MAVTFKDAVRNMNKDRSKKYFYFFCEKAKDGKPSMLADTKKIDPKKDEAAQEILTQAQAKGVSVGIMQIDEAGTLNLKPQGTGLTKSKLETGVKIAAGNAKVMDLIQGVNVGDPEAPGKDEKPGDGDDKSASWKTRWTNLGPALKGALITGGPQAEVVQKMATLALERAEKEDYEGALAVLGKLEPLLTSLAKPVSVAPPDLGKVKKLVGEATGKVDEVKKQAYEVNVANLMSKSGLLANHLDDILGAKGAKVTFVTDDPDMGSGGAYFDIKSNQIRIDAQTSPEKMADNLVFESCNAFNRQAFQELDNHFKQGTAPLADYGLAKAKIEFQTSVRYATLLKNLKDQGQPGQPLGESALKQLAEFEEKAPGYFTETDPEKRKLLEAALEKSFVESPQDAQATSGKGTLSSGELYMFEKVKTYTTGGVANLLFLDKHRKQLMGDLRPAWDAFRKWMEAYPDEENKDKRIAAFQQIMDAAAAYFPDVPINYGQFAFTPKLTQVGNELAGGWSMPPVPPRP